MNAKKTTYILTALLIAAIAGLLIWATAAENPDTVSPPPASGSGAESRPSAESGASSDSLPPDASSRPDALSGLRHGERRGIPAAGQPDAPAAE